MPYTSVSLRPALLATALAFTLAACGSEKADPNAKAAGGEILPGTISDAMINLDTSTATPPLAPTRGKKSGAAGEEEPTSGDASAAADDQAEPETAKSSPPAKPDAKPGAKPTAAKTTAPKSAE